MKLSNILLASIVSSSIGVSAQVCSVKKDSLSLKKNIKITSKTKQPISSIDSIKTTKRDIIPVKQRIYLHDHCPACGMG